jgi:menaquinol-cytochrome c reductase iron-sulfur subunit
MDAPSPNEFYNKHDDPSTSRRSFLGYVVAAASSFMAIILGVPILGYVTSPLGIKPKQGEWIRLGKVNDFANHEPQVVQFTLDRQDGWVEVKEARTCWVVPASEDRLLAFNGRCTHLGCAYSWQTQGENAGKFFCPCHDALYDGEGAVLDGPPPRRLDRLETKIENDELLVFYQDFRLGIPDQQPL